MVLTLAAALLLPLAAHAQTDAAKPQDYRAYVFGAYAVTFVLLFTFVAIVFVKQRAIDREITRLKK
jgi:heme exporter protein CcmD